MACYTLTTCGGTNPYYTFESTDVLLAVLVGQTVRLTNITPDSGIGPGMPGGMCWFVEEKGTCSTTYSINIDGSTADCVDCGPRNFLEMERCDGGGPNIIIGFIGADAPTLSDIIRIREFIPTSGCTLKDNTCYESISFVTPPTVPTCWTDNYEIIEGSNCVECIACSAGDIDVTLEIKEGCEDVYLKIDRVGWDETTSELLLTIDGVLYDISDYIDEIFTTGVTLTFDEQFTDGVHCWKIEVINAGYCNYIKEWCELSLCQACCKLKALAAKLLKDCDECDNAFKDKFLEAYAIYKALQLAGICGNDDAITKGLKTLNALLDELGCRDCKNC